MTTSVDVLGVRVDAISDEALNKRIGEVIEGARHTYFAYVNIHAVNLAVRDREFRDFLNAAPLVYCDGEGVRLGAKILGVRLPPRIVLTYWIWDLCAMCERRGYSIFLLGGRTDVVGRACENLQRAHPRLKVVGTHHGYFNKRGEESNRVIEMIRYARPNILFVCFGMPLQEHWVRENLPALDANMILFGGSTIDYAAGVKRVAPLWMRSSGLEWLFRLLQEPRRLWKRYLIGNPLFLGKVIVQRLHRGRSTL